MIDMQELRRVARVKGISNMSYAEKDYFQEIILLAISREAPDLVFKGGTALYKLHGLDRFSEDLDFSGEISRRKIDRITEYLNDFGYPSKVKINEPKAGTLITFVSEGFLYQGTPESLARVQMDVSAGEILLETEWKQMFPQYPDIPSFRLKSMSLEEMMSEKVRAMLVRMKARDAYDVWYLLNKGTIFNKTLIQKKLDMYDLKLNESLFNEVFEEIKTVWDKELRALMTMAPGFETVRKEIEEKL
ncbi:MAG: nucleotidyl transferase AbiEii/AbiGii toxin family protein [Thermoplasmata archaeon]|nr:nucleotidyl transferase AbiEii/AbiGii toxin family protein [Thermoplasmata archaeon]